MCLIQTEDQLRFSVDALILALKRLQGEVRNWGCPFYCESCERIWIPCYEGRVRRPFFFKLRTLILHLWLYQTIAAEWQVLKQSVRTGGYLAGRGWPQVRRRRTPWVRVVRWRRGRGWAGRKPRRGRARSLDTISAAVLGPRTTCEMPSQGILNSSLCTVVIWRLGKPFGPFNFHVAFQTWNYSPPPLIQVIYFCSWLATSQSWLSPISPDR